MILEKSNKPQGGFFMKHLMIASLLFLMPALSLSQEGGEALLKTKEEITVEVDEARLEEVGKTLRDCFQDARTNEEFRHKELIRQCFKNHISTSFAPVCVEGKELAGYKGKDAERRIEAWKDRESEVVLSSANELAKIRYEVAGNRTYWVIPKGEFHERTSRHVLEIIPYTFGGAVMLGTLGFWGGAAIGLFKGSSRLNKVTGKKEPIPGLFGALGGGIEGAFVGTVAGGVVGGVGGLGVGSLRAGSVALVGYLDRHKERRAYLVEIAKTQNFCNIPKETLVTQDFDIIESLGNRELTEAVKNGDIEKIKEYGNPVLLEASGNGNKRLVKALVNQGVDLETKDSHGRTAFFNAAFIVDEDQDMASFLIEKGANMDVQDTEKKLTPLHILSKAGKAQNVAFLLEKGANPNLRNAWGNTPLQLAIWDEQTDVVNAFLESKSTDVSVKDNQGKTALDFAKEKNLTEIVEALQSRSI